MKNNQHGCEVEDEATGQILVCVECAGHRPCLICQRIECEGGCM